MDGTPPSHMSRIDAVVHAVYSHKEELARVQSLRKPELQQYLQESQGHLDQLQTVEEMDMRTTEKLRVAALMVCFVKATK